jgi:phytoene synthase
VGPDVTGTAAGSSFHYSFWLLPAERRRALAAVYDFCRATDDLVDNHRSLDDKLASLGQWRSELRRAEGGGSVHPVLAPLAETSRRFDIPFGHYFDLVRGVEMDLTTTRYRTFADLAGYCALVASSVGLMCLPIFGRRNPGTEEYARRLGLALQLTNIIRDVATDAGFGRIYIPQEELERFGCPEAALLAGRMPPGFHELMSFQAERAEEYFSSAESALRPGDLAAMAPARVMAGIYRGTLRKIVRMGYDVFGGTVRLSAPVKLFIAMRYGLSAVLRRR